MALTEEEKKTARAYNIGYMLNAYEPRLLEKIIKSNPKNEFVQSMQVGRDHHEFYLNIPRTDYSREFKNGFYNGRTLAEHNPDLFDRLMSTKNLSKDYKRGLESAKKEYSIKIIQQKMNKEPKTPAKDLKNDENFQKGFNVGYRLAEQYGPALRHADNINGKYSRFIEGITLGKQQYEYDLSVLQEKDPNARIFPADHDYSKYETGVVENKLYAINDISNDQLRVIERQNGFEDMGIPKWLQKDRFNQPAKDETKNTDKDIDIEPDK